LLNYLLMMQSFNVLTSLIDHSPVLVQAIDQLDERAKILQLRIANSKCIAHRVSTIATSVSCEYAIDGYKLQFSNCTRYLGVHMDTELRFTHQISKIVHIGHSRAALILKCLFVPTCVFFVTTCVLS
jgi:hypothetical protein